MLRKFFIFLFIVNILALDSYLLYINFFKSSEGSQGGPVQSLKVDSGETSEVINIDNCGEECRRYIDEKIASIIQPSEETPSPTKKVEITDSSTQISAKSKVKSVSYVPIPGSGSTLNTDWVSLTGTDFYMSKSDYPGLLGVFFEANMKLMNGNGTAYLRIYDATHEIGVAGSEIETTSQNSTFVSGGPLNLWEGYNHYLVQAKSLTADTTIFESGRLKIITEN